MYLVPKCLLHRNVPGTETSPVPKCPGTEMSLGPKCPGTEMSLGPKCPGTEMSMVPKCPSTEMSLGPKCPGADIYLVPKCLWDRNVSGTEMSVPKCLMPKSLGPKCETAVFLSVGMVVSKFSTLCTCTVVKENIGTQSK